MDSAFTVLATPGQLTARKVYEVLRDHSGGPLEFDRILTELGDEQIAGSTLAQEQLLEALLRDDRLRSARGYRQRFSMSGRSIRLRPPGNRAELAIEQENGQVKEQLLKQLREVPPEVFEHIVADLFTAMKYEDVKVTRRSKDGGVDVRATLVAGGVMTVPTAIQVKRWSKPVTVKEVRELRGTLRAGTQGIIVTTGGYTKDAPKEALDDALTPIHLIDGRLLTDLLTEHGIGVQASRLSLLSLDLEALATITGKVGSPLQGSSSQPSQNAQPRYYIEKMPSDRGKDLLGCIVSMTDLADGQPSWDDYVVRFQERFPTITRSDEARRRSRVLVSLGLVDVENDHMNLTLAGRKLLENPDSNFLLELFLSRIVGAREIEGLSRSLTRADLRKKLQDGSLAGLTPTQATLVEKWLSHIKRPAASR
ncbi:restriction endonuclease [Streptomyces rishiriensis]|uniref:restriction endonuclease n=1 Tax=Streptomyces rishiriensis TaxID=68264 RepID=UPI000D5950C3|nr:restriction endonuclease [Streptomyces rishiriensis]